MNQAQLTSVDGLISSALPAGGPAVFFGNAASACGHAEVRIK